MNVTVRFNSYPNIAPDPLFLCPNKNIDVIHFSIKEKQFFV